MKVRTAYEQELTNLDEMVSAMGKTVGDALHGAILAWQNGNKEKAKAIMAADEGVNQTEKQIEHLCLTLLLRQTPVAGDLRRVSAALKMDTDLERIGDHAQDIAELSLAMPLPQNHPEWLAVVQRMADTAQKMITAAMESFRTQDVAKAQAVRSWDDAQDADFVKIKSLLASHLTTSPTDMDEVLDWLMLAKYLERVADHAVNLADWAEFSVTGLHKNTRLL